MRSDPIEQLEESARLLQKELEDLKGKGYEGTWIKRKEGAVERIKTATERIREKQEEDAKERQDLSHKYEEMSYNMDRLFLFASIYLDSELLAFHPFLYTREELEQRHEDPMISKADN